MAANSIPSPKSRSQTPHKSGSKPMKQVREMRSVQLELCNIIGNTINSINAFDSSMDTFACCAGSFTILSRVDERLKITQRLFRTRRNALPINANLSYYNPAASPSATGKSRRESPLKDRGCGVACGNLSGYPDSPSQGRADNLSKETSCVSLSRGGNLLAVGETGYNPRVFIFSTAPDHQSDSPLSVLNDHSFGISSVAFSDDCRWLCTLGNNHDNFILIYSVNVKTGSAKLHSSNKCSNVHRVTWMGQRLISIGTRHVKVWRPSVSPSKTSPEMQSISIGSTQSQSSTPKTFSGRNCLLGSLMDAKFTSVAAVSDCRAIICTTQGNICLLDDTHQAQRLRRVAQADFGIFCALFDHASNTIWIGGRQGNVKSMHLDSLLKSTVPINAPAIDLPIFSSDPDSAPDILAIGLVRGRVITTDSRRVIEIRAPEDSGKAFVVGSESKRLPAHESAVLGVSSLLPKARFDGPDFLTFSARGTVLFWLLDSTCTGSAIVPLDQPNCSEAVGSNELKIVVPLGSDEYLLTGDKLGILRLVDRPAGKEAAVQAHDGEINVGISWKLTLRFAHGSDSFRQPLEDYFDCMFIRRKSLIRNRAQNIAVALTARLTIIATCGRDRTLQLFQKIESQLVLLQTLDDHAAAVGDVQFLDQITLLSISSDRTMIVRKSIRGDEQPIFFFSVRVITLKASPISLTVVPAEPSVVLVSTSDRQILRYNVSSGQLLHCFKASDPTTGNSVIMSSLEVHKFDFSASAVRLVLGVSSTDKSIRIHDFDSGAMLMRNFGQNAVSAIKLLQNDIEGEGLHNFLISCGLDGTVMTWDLSCTAPKVHGIHGAVNEQSQRSASAQPLRRMMSKAEFIDLQRNRGDSMTPLTASSPCRVRCRASKSSMATANQGFPLAVPSSTSTSVSPTVQEPQCHFLPSNSTLATSQNIISKSRLKSHFLENRPRSKSVADLDDLNVLGDQICILLRDFRNRTSSSLAVTLKDCVLQELATELSVTFRALDRKPTNFCRYRRLESDILEEDLAKIIND